MEPEAKRAKLDDGTEQTNNGPDSAPEPLNQAARTQDTSQDDTPADSNDVPMTDTATGGTSETAKESLNQSATKPEQGKTELTDRNDETDETTGETDEAAEGVSTHKGIVCQEKDVGITEYVSQHEGFTAIIKQRFSDFLVNEIGEKGEIIRITDKSVPSCDIKEPVDSSIIPDDVKSQLEELVKGDVKQVEWKIEGDNKQQRSDIHKAIRENYSGLNSTTQDKEDGKCIRVVQGNKNNRSGRGERQSWYHKGDFCQFVLYKENKDTADALHVISKFLGLQTKAFSFSGTKDKRAKTSQLATIHRVEASRLQAINDKLINMDMGNFSYVSKGLKLGDLKGNHFTIVLRNVTGSDEQLRQAMTSLVDVGFVNYFGMQRFGTTSVSTHSVGRAMLQQKFDEAIELILKPREGDTTSVNEARQHWWKTRNAKEALNKMGGRRCLDRHLLTGLVKHRKTDYVGALSVMPRNTRLMYIHAYQSYVWNLMVSSRIRRYGLKPVPGDLVLVGAEENDSKSNQQQVEELTEATVANYSIHDVVMPLPGYAIRYPGNELEQEYKDLLKKDGLQGGLKSPVRDYSLPGNYRKIMSKPNNVKWETCFYDDPTISLVLSDGEILDGKTLEPRQQEGKFKAAIVEFSLASSTYATMALREILKCDTSAACMTQLNVT